tara:strand:- start:49 stop:318 length:270 start_codon:yes stop_codon:yes gene_type:complete
VINQNVSCTLLQMSVPMLLLRLLRGKITLPTAWLGGGRSLWAASLSGVTTTTVDVVMDVDLIDILGRPLDVHSGGRSFASCTGWSLHES